MHRCFPAILAFGILAQVASAQVVAPADSVTGDTLKIQRTNPQTRDRGRELRYGLIGGLIGGTVTNLGICKLAPDGGECGFYPLGFQLGFVVGLIGGLAIATADDDDADARLEPPTHKLRPWVVRAGSQDVKNQHRLPLDPLWFSPVPTYSWEDDDPQAFVLEPHTRQAPK